FLSVCEEYSSLNIAAAHQGINVWHVQPQFHMFPELAQYQSLELGNPKGFSEYKDEDLFVCEVG
ncbi:MAG: hypothetical protein ACKPKO_31045, partial [Candidatus Fonsibacter sp.]